MTTNDNTHDDIDTDQTFDIEENWTEAVENSQADDLYWMTDVPYYIDDKQIDQIYKSILNPSVENKSVTLDVTDETAKQLESSLNFEGELSTGKALGLIMDTLIKPKIRGGGRMGGSYEQREGFGRTIQLEPVQTPQKKLRQLTAYYLLNLNERVFLVDDPGDSDWRSEENIKDVPRELAFLDLPSESDDGCKTKMVPLIAEFGTGDIFTIYDELESDTDRPDKYPVREDYEQIDDFTSRKREFSGWFYENFNSRQASQIVSDLTREHGRIEWIDYLVPVTEEGETVELTLRPGGRYPNGKFARDFIQDGYQHGWRIVGMVRSGPKVEVLAIFSK